jgi:deoxyribose-phosphate aldolase
MLSLTSDQQRLAAAIDHTLLKPESTQAQIAVLCDEALLYSFASVCVHPCYVEYAAARLQGSTVKVCTVIGFPLGANDTATKVFETELAVKRGAREVDMVINIGALKSGTQQGHEFCERDIVSVVECAMRHNALSKVIIETALLTEAEKTAVCGMVSRAGADFIKTSTGFASGGATVADVEHLRKHCAPEVAIKASGGIRDYAFAVQLLRAGASRLGTSSGVAIVKAAAPDGAGSSAAAQQASQVASQAGY